MLLAGLLRDTLFPYTTLFRSGRLAAADDPAPTARRVHAAGGDPAGARGRAVGRGRELLPDHRQRHRSEEHTSELQSPDHLVCRLLLEKKKNTLSTNM